MEKLNQTTEDLAELKELLKQAQRPRIKDFLGLEIRRLETALISLKESSETTPTAPVATQKSSSTPARFTTDLKNYGWDQSDKFVKVFVTLNGVQNVPDSNVKATYTNRGFALVVEDLDNKDHKLVLNNLLESVLPEKSYHKVKTDMVVLYIAKATAGQRWEFLTQTAKKVSASTKSEPALDGLEENPNAALMNIMKKMYESGDASTKQMIEKAYTENMNKPQMGM